MADMKANVEKLIADSTVTKMIDDNGCMQVFIGSNDPRDKDLEQLKKWIHDLYKKGWIRLHSDGTRSWYEDSLDLIPGDHAAASDAYIWDKAGMKASYTRCLHTCFADGKFFNEALGKVWKNPCKD